MIGADNAIVRLRVADSYSDAMCLWSKNWQVKVDLTSTDFDPLDTAVFRYRPARHRQPCPQCAGVCVCVWIQRPKVGIDHLGGWQYCWDSSLRVGGSHGNTSMRATESTQRQKWYSGMEIRWVSRVPQWWVGHSPRSYLLGSARLTHLTHVERNYKTITRGGKMSTHSTLMALEFQNLPRLRTVMAIVIGKFSYIKQKRALLRDHVKIIGMRKNCSKTRYHLHNFRQNSQTIVFFFVFLS